MRRTNYEIREKNVKQVIEDKINKNEIDENKTNRNKIDGNKIDENKISKNKINQNKVNEKKVRRKKEDLKYLIIMLVMVTASAGGGYIAGRIMGKIKTFPEFTNDFFMKLSIIMSVIFLAINIMLLIVAVVCLSKARKQFKQWDGEDEDLADKIERIVFIPICLSSIFTIINMFLFAVCINLDINTEMSKGAEKAFMFANIIIFIVSCIITVGTQKKCVDIVKDMNPEKKGSIFDMHFSKKWADSCDEAEMFYVYKASATAFKVMSTLCMVLWIICVIADLFFEIGIVPVTMVTIIWVAGAAAYQIGVCRAEKSNR